MTSYSYQLPLDFNVTRLDKALLSLLPNISRNRIQKAIKDHAVKINNIIIADCAYKVKRHDLIEITIIEPLATKLQETSIALDIIFEDEDLMVINKPAGLTVHPGAGNQRATLVNALLYHAKQLSNIGAYFRPGIVHRLDKDTSGLMIVAKNNDAHLNIAKQIENRTLIRKYKALAWGVMMPPAGIIQTNIGRDKILRQKMTVLKVGGKHAVTCYQTETIYLKGLISLINCELKTGRTHQIRVHLSHAGHSIVGDQTYGHNRRKIKNLPSSLPMLINLQRQALHSYYLAFIHPTTAQFLEFSIELPLDITKVINHMQTLECGY